MDIEQLLKLNRDQRTIQLRYLILPVMVLFLMYAWQQRIFTGWVLLPLIWNIVVWNLWLIAQLRNRRLQRIAELSFDAVFLRDLQIQFPYLNIRQRRLIEQGFKDYLALHALEQQAYAMPSHAVDSLWHIMLNYPEKYNNLCKQTVGRVIKHQPYDEKTTPEEQSKQLFTTWRVSCMLHNFKLNSIEKLPRLFAIDQALNWQNGQSFDVEKMNQDYAQYLKDHTSSSCGGSSCSSCSSCGGD